MDDARIDRFTNRPPTPAQAQALSVITVAMLGVDEILHKLLASGSTSRAAGGTTPSPRPTRSG